MEQYGRSKIYTDAYEITRENVGQIVRDAMSTHEVNATSIRTLKNYEAGLQVQKRKKTYRPDIDNWCVDNIANEITEFKLSFNWGNPITLAMRDRNNENKDIADAVFNLNKYYELQENRSKQQELARSVEIGGIGYTHIDINTDYEQGDSPFVLSVLNPECTFVVRSSYYLDERVMMAVTFSCDKENRKHFTCITPSRRYELDWQYNHKERSGEANPLGIINIIEWERSKDRMGCFERQISEMDNLNLLVSDFTNDVEQNTNAVWHSNDIDFPTKIVKDENGEEKEVSVGLKGNAMVQTYTSQDGKTPFLKAIAIDYDYTGMLNNINTRRALILQKCNVPSRNDNSGGSTGVAMSDATGWTQAETEANRQDQLKDVSKLQEVKVVLRAIVKCVGFPMDNPLRTLHYSDVQANIPRLKTYELNTKTNAICALINKGFALEDALTIAPLFEDNNQVLIRSGEGVRRYQEASVFANGEAESTEGRPFPDLSDQAVNSPKIDGPRME